MQMTQDIMSWESMKKNQHCCLNPRVWRISGSKICKWGVQYANEQIGSWFFIFFFKFYCYDYQLKSRDKTSTISMLISSWLGVLMSNSQQELGTEKHISTPNPSIVNDSLEFTFWFEQKAELTVLTCGTNKTYFEMWKKKKQQKPRAVGCWRFDCVFSWKATGFLQSNKTL